MTLKLDWCSYEAAKYAVEHWHYSHSMPKSKLAKIGVWDDGAFIGVVVFGVGATSDLVKRFQLLPTQGCELVRIALREHKAPVSRIGAIALRMLTRTFPGLRLVVSFADPEHNHVGSIYQAMNWVYTGMSSASAEYIVNGKRWHGRAFRASKPAHLTTKQAASILDPNYQTILGSSKYRYLMPLDDAMRRQIAPLAKLYPKRAVSILADASADHAEENGAAPITALQSGQ